MRGSSDRLGWGDALRCWATLAVILLHATGSLLGRLNVYGATWRWVELLSGLTRWSVPVFVMLSGAFFLDPDKELTTRKWLGHIARLGVATVVWTFGYALWDTRGACFGLEHFLEALAKFTLGEFHYHLWFLPMMLGMYLLIPPLRALVKGAKRRTLWYAIGLWGVFSLVLPRLWTAVPYEVGILWLERFELYHVFGYVGYFLLGWLLRSCDLGGKGENILYVLGAAGLAATVGGTSLLSRSAGEFMPQLFSYYAPGVVLTAAALFLAFRRFDLGRAPAWGKLAGCTFGVYLVHPLVMALLKIAGFPAGGWNAAAGALAQTVAVAVLSLAVAWVLRHIPRVGRFIA